MAEGVTRIPPGPGQESVWDYPRPPRVEPVPERLRVVVGGTTIADTTAAARPRDGRRAGLLLPTGRRPAEDLRPSPRETFCEWKGGASYHTLWSTVARSRTWPGRTRTRSRASSDPRPSRVLRRQVDEAWVGDELATPQPGGFYGGWVTSRIVGPMKGEPGSAGW